LRRRATRPQLKRDPLGARTNVTSPNPSPDELEREFRRVGITWRTFAELVRENRWLDAAPRGFAISIGPETWDLLRSPPGRGGARFLHQGVQGKVQGRGGGRL